MTHKMIQVGIIYLIYCIPDGGFILLTSLHRLILGAASYLEIQSLVFIRVCTDESFISCLLGQSSFFQRY